MLKKSANFLPPFHILFTLEKVSQLTCFFKTKWNGKIKPIGLFLIFSQFWKTKPIIFHFNISVSSEKASQLAKFLICSKFWKSQPIFFTFHIIFTLEKVSQLACLFKTNWNVKSKPIGLIFLIFSQFWKSKPIGSFLICKFLEKSANFLHFAKASQLA